MSRRRRRRTILWVSLLVAAAIGVLVGVLVTRPAPTSTSVPSSLLGKPAPDFGGASLSGQPVSLAGLRGRFVLVNFFASRCDPCRTEAPELVQLDHQHQGRADLTILGVALNDTISQSEAFLRSSGAVWPAIQDPHGYIAVKYGVHGPPESFLVAPDGIVVARFTGPVTIGEVDRYMAVARTERA